MRFEFATADRILFGEGVVSEVGQLISQMGDRVFLVADDIGERAGPIIEQLERQRLNYSTFEVRSEPSTMLVSRGLAQARQAKSNVVIGIGGGSVIDTAKAVAGLLTNGGELEDYLEVIGKGNPITERSAPFIAIPTTAGTGAEVTRNAVLAVPEKGVKVSMRSPLLLAHAAVVDPELTYSMPKQVTAATGLDALTQLIEAYVSNKSNSLTDGICREGMRRSAGALQRAYADGTDQQARRDMCLASLFGGLALANAKLGAVHGFAGPLGGMIWAAHGSICASLLPAVMNTNVQALRTRQPGSEILLRYDEVGRILTGKQATQAEDGIGWVRDVCRELAVPSLSELGLEEEDFPQAVEKAGKASSMKGNPICLTEQELLGILEESL